MFTGAVEHTLILEIMIVTIPHYSNHYIYLLIVSMILSW